MIDARYAETLGFKRMDGEPEEHFEKRVRRLAYHAPIGTVQSMAEAIADACWHVDRVGHRVCSQEFKAKKLWHRLAWKLFGVKRYEPHKRYVEEFAVMVKRGEEPDHGAIHLAVDACRPVGVSMQQIELHYFTVLA